MHELSITKTWIFSHGLCDFPLCFDDTSYL
nr:MAG TPA: hydrogenase/urease nickel incorporation protein [Caudoviricetes sp.]